MDSDFWVLETCVNFQEVDNTLIIWQNTLETKGDHIYNICQKTFVKVFQYKFYNIIIILIGKISFLNNWIISNKSFLFLIMTSSVFEEFQNENKYTAMHISWSYRKLSGFISNQDFQSYLLLSSFYTLTNYPKQKNMEKTNSRNSQFADVENRIFPPTYFKFIR